MGECEILFDYMTMVYIDKRPDVSVSDAVSNMLDTLHLGELWDNFACVGRNRFYPYIYRYNDITVKICDEDKLGRQGLCVEFSGNGLAFYQGYLLDIGENLRRVCQSWRSFAVGGIFTRFTRVDVAKDEICYNDDKPTITLRKIRCAVNNRDFCSRFIIDSGKKRKILDMSDDFSHKNEEDNGYTIAFGRRTSLIYCRFYDKLLEQRAKEMPVDDSINSWVRCEFEFHNSRAMAVINAFCDMYDDVSGESDFSEYISEVFNNYIRFINRDDINRSRCSSKRWWAAFIGTVKRSRLAIPRFKPVTFNSMAEWLERQVFPSLRIYLRCVGLQRFLAALKRATDDIKLTPKQRQAQNDFINEFIKGEHKSKEISEHLSLDPWLFTSGCAEKDYIKQIEKEYRRFHTVNGNCWEPVAVDETAMQWYMSSLCDWSVVSDGM